MDTIILDAEGTKIFTADMPVTRYDGMRFQAKNYKQVADWFLALDSYKNFQFRQGKDCITFDWFEIESKPVTTPAWSGTFYNPTIGILKVTLRVSKVSDRKLEDMTDKEKLESALAALNKAGIKIEVK